MKIGLRTPLNPRSGYGKDGLGLASALLERGHDVRLSPTSVQAPLPRHIAGILTEPFDGNFDLFISHQEPHLERGVKPGIARRSVFWSMWEWDSIESQEWSQGFSEALSGYDSVVAYTPQAAAAFEPYTGSERLSVVQGGFDSSEWKVPERGSNAHDGFNYSMIGVLGTRKNPLSVIAAFMQLKEEHGDAFDASLTLKSSIPIMPGVSNYPPGVIVVEGEEWYHDQVQEFYWLTDLLLCPSWGEGKNLPALEALTSGTPVALSDISAHRQWAFSDIVTFFETEHRPLFPGTLGLDGGYVTAEAAKKVMWEAYTNRFDQRRKADLGARMIPSMMDWDKAVERLSNTLGLNI